MIYLNLILLVIFIILQIRDAKTTKKILSQNGYEKQPVMKLIIDKFGIKGLVVSKVILCLAWFLIVAFNINYPITATLQIVAVAVYGYVIWKNYTQIK